MKPEDVHPSHEVVDDGWFISDPHCVKCGYGRFFNEEMLMHPCEGKQLDFWRD